MRIMRFLNRLFNNKRDGSGNVVINNTSTILTTWPFESATDDIAMKIATVFRCVDIVSSAVASMGLQVKQRRTTNINGVQSSWFEVDTFHPLYNLLAYQPNDRQTAFELVKNAVSAILLKGNAYILPIRRGVEVEQLVLLTPDSTTYDARLDVYRVDDDINNIHGMYDSWEIIHLRNVCTDGGYEGISTLQFAANTLNIASRIDSQQADFYKSGSTLRGFVSGDTSITQGFGSLQDEQLEAVSQSVEAQLNSGRKIFQLPGAMKFNQISLSPNDLQLLDSKKFTVLEICRFFGVHPDKVFSQSSTNYKASENSQTVFLSDTLQPLLKKISLEMNVKLIFVENMWRFRIFFNLEDYYEADILSKADYYGKMLSNAAMTPNEIRIKTGKAPQAGGDTVFISCNVAPVGSSKITGEQSSTEGEKTQQSEDLGAKNE